MRTVVATLLTLSLGSLAHAQAEAVLEGAMEKLPRLRYKGERIVEVVIGGKPVKLVEFVSRDRDKARITYPGDSPRKGFIIVENARERWEFNPERNEVRRSPHRRGGSAMLLRGLSHGVREGKLKASLAPQEDVAGKRTAVVKVIDGKGNLVHRLWIEEGTGMILKAEQFGPADRRMARYAFTKIDFTPTFSPNEFDPPRPPGARIIDRPPDFGVDWKIRIPGWLPPNFKEVGRGSRRFEGRPIVMLHFSDGSKNFSVFQGRGSRPPKFDRDGGRPGHEYVTRLFDSLWFVGLGRVERATLDRVLKSIR